MYFGKKFFIFSLCFSDNRRQKGNKCKRLLVIQQRGDKSRPQAMHTYVIHTRRWQWAAPVPGPSSCQKQKQDRPKSIRAGAGRPRAPSGARPPALLAGLLC